MFVFGKVDPNPGEKHLPCGPYPTASRSWNEGGAQVTAFNQFPRNPFLLLLLLLLLLFLGPLPRHMEIPRLGVELEL